MLIGITGYAGVGKDTLADLLCENTTYKKVSFATKVKDLYLILAPENQLNFIKEQGWDYAKHNDMNIRSGLQGLGSACRLAFGKDFWITQAMPSDAELKQENFVFADVRYMNEALAIQEKGGIVIRLDRDGVFPANQHISEVGVDEIPADLVITNHLPQSALSEVLEFIRWGEMKS